METPAPKGPRVSTEAMIGLTSAVLACAAAVIDKL